jgi:hypothetical protein
VARTGNVVGTNDDHGLFGDVTTTTAVSGMIANATASVDSIAGRFKPTIGSDHFRPCYYVAKSCLAMADSYTRAWARIFSSHISVTKYLWTKHQPIVHHRRRLCCDRRDGLSYVVSLSALHLQRSLTSPVPLPSVQLPLRIVPVVAAHDHFNIQEKVSAPFCSRSGLYLHDSLPATADIQGQSIRHVYPTIGFAR